MILQAAKPKEKKFYIDIQNNLEKPESERFGFSLVLPTRSKSINIIKGVDDEGEIDINYDKYIKVHVKSILNPIDFQVDGGPLRKITIDDILKYSVCDEIWTQLLQAINDLKVVDIKK